MSSEDVVSRPKYSCIPRRYVMIALSGIVGVMVLPVKDTLRVVRRYIDDIGISNVSRSIASIEQCKELGKIISLDLPYKEIHSKKYNLNDEVMNSLPWFQIPSFIVTHFVAAIVSDKYGAKHVVGVAVVVLSVCMIFTPVLIQSSDANINVLRFVASLEGTAEGALIPAMACFIAHWAPPGEIGALSSLSLAALYSGNIISNLATEAMIIKSEDWTLPFYVYGGLLVGVFLIWHLVAFSNPHQDPRISPAERFYLDMEMKGIVDHQNKKIPLCQILMSLDVWSAAIILSVFIWYWIFLADYLPRYMNVVWKVNIRQSGMWAAGPFVIMIITGVGFGFLSDWVVNYHLINVATMRKVCTNDAWVQHCTWSRPRTQDATG
ncbi:sodium-dependent phosphate transport protein 1-like isoform X2 [Tenebrio molitor]|uniref:sodium-dependent phosphate transport protein 1-like isoform X2 n=1 Tax=Tenebrio molitor TaxID=7067 RepID=UPI0036246C15